MNKYADMHSVEMSSINWVPVEKSVVDGLSGSQVKIEFEYVNGELKFIIIKQGSQVFRIQADGNNLNFLKTS